MPDLFDPRFFEARRFNYRLAVVLFALIASNEWVHSETAKSGPGKTIAPVSTPGLERLLLGLAEKLPSDCAQAGSWFAWPLPANTADLALCAPVVAESAAGLLELDAPPTGQWYSLATTRELRKRRREWLEQREGQDGMGDGTVAPAYLNDALSYAVPEPPRECSVEALLWRHETSDGVWYLPSSPLPGDAARAAPHAMGAGGDYAWVRRLSWVLDGLLEQKPEVTDLVLDLPPGTWGFAHQILLLAGHLWRGGPLPAGCPAWSKTLRWLVNPFIVTSRERNDRVVAIEYFLEVRRSLPGLVPLCNRLSVAPARLRAEIQRDLPEALQTLGIEDLLRIVPELPRSLGSVFTEGNVVVEEEGEIAKALRLESPWSGERAP